MAACHSMFNKTLTGTKFKWCASITTEISGFPGAHSQDGASGCWGLEGYID